MRALANPLDALAAARGRLFAFVPVCLALGIGGYFSLPVEPGAPAYAIAAAGVALFGGLWRAGPERWQPLAAALALAFAGALVAGARAHVVAAPVLDGRYYGAIEGRIIAVDRSLSDRLRITLDEVVLERRPPARTPARVRVSLHGQQGFTALQPGRRVILTGYLMAPSPPAEPGGFDFRRHAWFERLGAVGYTRTPVLALAPAAGSAAGLWVDRLRMRISSAVQARLDGEPGAFTAAILTGDRSGIGRATLDDLRGANLSHFLAISGLHMGLLTGFVFAALRYGLALVPPVAMRLPARKLAAGLALAAAAFYLALSGGNVATQRAFVMVAVMLVAVLADRRAISLRSVAIAATLLLTLRPEMLLQAGFQMSFAATTALVAVFAALRARGAGRHAPRWLRPVLGVVLCSLVAGLATAPVSAAHFNRIAEYGLLANLLSVPLMGTVMMPAAALAGALAPLGLAGLALTAMEMGARWILGVAGWVAGLDGAVIAVPAPPRAALPIIALGALWLVLWPGGPRARLAGLAPVLLGFALWGAAERPALLVSHSGLQVGLLTPEGRALSRARSDGFIVRSWLENDGDPALPETAHARAGFAGRAGAATFRLTGPGGRALQGVALSGRGASDRVAAHCGPGRLVVVSTEPPADPGDCMLLDPGRLARTGSVAVELTEEGVRLRGARQRAGERLWTGARR
ncbi:competence protein [Rhodobacteraceae bacterium WD3A24]|nr:competence protein [Rhodobacteraceae bacterium WD3A24]